MVGETPIFHVPARNPIETHIKNGLFWVPGICLNHRHISLPWKIFTCLSLTWCWLNLGASALAVAATRLHVWFIVSEQRDFLVKSSNWKLTPIGLRVSPTIYPPQHKAPVKRLLQTLGSAMSFLLAMAFFFLFFVFGIQWHPNWLSEDVALHRRGDCHCGCDQLWSLDLESKTRQKTEEMSVLGYFGFILYILFKGTTDHCNPRCKLPWIYQYDQVIRDFVDIWYHFEHWGNHQEYWNEKQKNLSKIYQYISMYIYDDIFIYIYT